jgi:arsenate reductase (thioredoxin)
MQITPEKIKILFLCTGNACRSQVAEGWTRHLRSNRIEACSGGIEPKGVDRRAIEAMAEVGVDISSQTSKHVEALGNVPFDFVVTLCDHAQEACPFFPAGTRVLHVGFEDPPKLALGAKSEAEAMSHYKRVRDEIRRFIETLPPW